MTMWVIGTEKLVTDAYAYSIATPNHIALPSLRSPLCVSVLELQIYPASDAIGPMLLLSTNVTDPTYALTLRA